MPIRTCSPMSGATLHPSDPFDREHEPIVGDKRLERLIDRLPRFLRSSVRWLRQPSLIWLRIAAGVLLIAGGLLSFLPIFGLWMPRPVFRIDAVLWLRSRRRAPKPTARSSP